MGFTVRDVAEAAGVGYRTCLAHEKAGLWVYGDLVSVATYIMRNALNEPMSFSARYELGEKLDAWAEKTGVAKSGMGYICALSALKYGINGEPESWKSSD